MTRLVTFSVLVVALVVAPNAWGQATTNRTNVGGAQFGGGAGGGTGRTEQTGQITNAIDRGTSSLGGQSGAAFGGAAGGARAGGAGGRTGGLGGFGGLGGLGGFGGGFGGLGGFGGFGFGGGFQQQQNNTPMIRAPLKLAFKQKRTPANVVGTRFQSRLTRISKMAGSRIVVKMDDEKKATLTGTVPTLEQKNLAARLAVLEPGIYQVDNQIQVTGEED